MFVSYHREEIMLITFPFLGSAFIFFLTLCSLPFQGDKTFTDTVAPTEQATTDTSPTYSSVSTKLNVTAKKKNGMVLRIQNRVRWILS